MTFAVGQTVGPYRIVEQIGQGGMATVYKAYHANLDRYVAFKVLHPAFKEDPNFLERFKREAQIVARLEHPAIVPIYDYADVAGNPYLVMKFIEGETLKARLKRHPLTLAETIQILESVAVALTYAHEQGILHRDIKPSNIMLDKNGTPYIADFGLARIAQAGESTLSQDTMLGTPQYMSPEQAQGVRDLGPGTDIYSLGVVLYEIVVGRVPFNADTPYAIVHDHIYKALPLPSQVNPEVPAEIERVLLKTLAKAPQDRYETAVDMVAAFRRAVQETGLTELSAARYRVSAQPISSSAATLPPDAAMPPSTPAFVGVPAPMPQTLGSSSSRQAYRRRRNLWILGGFGALLLICLAGLFVLVKALSENEAGAQPAASATPAVLKVPKALTLEEAQRLVKARPDDPASYFVLALAQFKSGDREAAQHSVAHAIDELHASADLIATTARFAATEGYSELATWLYLEALSQDNLPPALRNEAGEFLYRRAQSAPAVVGETVNQYMARRSENAFTHTVAALALLQFNRQVLLTQASGQINEALRLNDALSETYLVRGLYYRAIGQIEDARSDWQKAASLPGAPQWLTSEVDSLSQQPS